MNRSIIRIVETTVLVSVMATACVIAPPAGPTSPPEAVVLKPHTDEGYGIETVLPEGWQPRGFGVVWRKHSATDLTLIVQQSADKPVDELLATLLPRLQVNEAPGAVATYAGRALTWTLYRVTISMTAGDLIVDLALAQSDATSYFVFLQTTPAEHDALYESVFLPTLDAFTPLNLEAEPVPYAVLEVTFASGDVALAGTLTLPRSGGPYPAVVLVTGSGPQDRDNGVGGIAMKPFRLIADALTREGYAVLRYDDRGVGASTGDFLGATLSDFADDAQAAVAFLLARSDIDRDRLGLLGHSEGGLVAAMLGARDEEIDYLIVMAGPGLKGRDLLVLQTRRRLEVDGASPAEIEAEVSFVEALAAAVDDPAAIEDLAYERALAQAQALSAEERAALGDLDLYARNVARQTAKEYGAGWFESFLDYDPAVDWARTRVPVLALFGGKDVQVDAAQNAAALEAALQSGGNGRHRIITFANANHVFQTASTGSFNEYASLPAEFVPDFLPTIVEWLDAQGRGP